MSGYICLVGLDEPEVAELKMLVKLPIIAHPILPKMIVQRGQLWVESDKSVKLLPVSKVVYHGIFEEDLDFIVGLALWGGPCLPNPRAMMDARLKLPCLVRALEHTRFGYPRGYASAWANFDSPDEQVAKWGNWHCGENKERFRGVWSSENAVVIEPYIEGQAVRVLMFGQQAWQIRLEGDDWLKSIHHANADFMPLDPDLADDTDHLRGAFGLEIIANDYMVTPDGQKFLLEVNHIPNVTRFQPIWEAYRDFVAVWLME